MPTQTILSAGRPLLCHKRTASTLNARSRRWRVAPAGLLSFIVESFLSLNAVSVKSGQPQPFLRRLDEGERTVIALAGRLPPPVTVVMDDAAGRAVARRVGLPVLGFAGLLMVAKERGLIQTVVPSLAARAQGYWLDDALI